MRAWLNPQLDSVSQMRKHTAINMNTDGGRLDPRAEGRAPRLLPSSHRMWGLWAQHPDIWGPVSRQTESWLGRSAQTQPVILFSHPPPRGLSKVSTSAPHPHSTHVSQEPPAAPCHPTPTLGPYNSSRILSPLGRTRRPMNSREPLWVSRTRKMKGWSA